MKEKSVLKKISSFFIAVVLVVQIGVTNIMAEEYWPLEPTVNSPNAIVMELSTGTVLYERSSSERRYPASITKIMTTLIALENSNLDEIVTFSNAAIDNTEGSGIARDYGEQMTMEECLYAIMLESANECAYAVAEHVGGSIEEFCTLMNQKAAELGCQNTNFVNPHGLHDDNHYTSCYDMALIAKAAYENETFRIITGTKTRMIPPTNKHSEETPLQNHNKLLHRYQRGNYVYEYCTGGKTGYTTMSNATLVTYAEKEGMTLVCVVMNTDNVSEWTDSVGLFNYCFDNFHLINVAESETSTQKETEGSNLSGTEPFVSLDKEAKIILPKTAEFSDVKSEIHFNAEVSKVAGTIYYYYANRMVGTADIVATGVEVESYVFDNQKDSIQIEDDVTTIQIKPIMIVFFIIGMIILLGLFLAGKYLYDNIYIIRHNLWVEKDRKNQDKALKRKNQRPKRRR